LEEQAKTPQQRLDELKAKLEEQESFSNLEEGLPSSEPEPEPSIQGESPIIV
jgi:hypothetical protein